MAKAVRLRGDVNRELRKLGFTFGERVAAAKLASGKVRTVSAVVALAYHVRINRKGTPR